MKRLGVLVLCVLFLAGCSKAPQTTTPNVESIFSDTDISNATLSLADNVEVIAATTVEEEYPATESEPLPNPVPEPIDTLRTQATLPGADGFIYYIRYDPTSQYPWSISRANQASGGLAPNLYVGQREIQAIAGSGDGKSVVVSMRESASASSDFEIYRLTISTAAVQQLTQDTVDNIDVSMSINASTIAWQEPVNSVPSIVFRVYTSATFSQKRLSYPLPSRQPSLSSNGKFITYIHDRADGYDQIWRYDIPNNVYKAIHSRELKLSDPSITDDGNKIMFSIADRSAYIFDVTTSLYQLAVYTTRTIVHPFITADGKYMTYGYSPQLPSANPTNITVYAKALSTGQLAVIQYPNSTSVRQLGMSWQYNLPITAPSIPLVLSEQKLTAPRQNGLFGWSVDISGNTAIVGSYGESYDINKDGVISCDSGNVGLECSLGAAYVLERNAQGIWNVMTRIENPVIPDIYNHPREFASTVAISGDTVVIGYRDEVYDADGNGIRDCPSYTGNQKDSSECLGRVYVFSRNQGGANKWGLVKRLTASDDTASRPPNAFGYSLDIVGSTIVVGIYPNLYGGDINGDNTLTCPGVPNECAVGTVYIYSQNQGGANNWGFVKQLKPPTQNINNYFGISLALADDTLLVASPYKNYLSGTEYTWLQPSFYVYSRNQGGTNAWGLVKELSIDNVPNLSDSSINSVAINGTTAVVGRTSVNDKSVYIFSRDQGGANNWGRVKKVSFGTETEISGQTVAISGDTILFDAQSSAYDANQNGTIECVDGFGVECNLGVVYVLSRNQGGTNNWGTSKLLGARDALTTGTEARFGSPVALDGNTVIVGANYDAQRGAVYIFKP